MAYRLKIRSRLWRLMNAVLPPPAPETLHKLSKRFHHPDLNTADKSPTITRARLALESKDYAEAVVLFTQLTRLNDQNAWAWHGLGDSYQLLDSPQTALDAYSKAIALQPDEGLHYGGRANAHHSLGNHRAESGDWTRALELNPNLTWMRPTTTQGIKDQCLK